MFYFSTSQLNHQCEVCVKQEHSRIRCHDDEDADDDYDQSSFRLNLEIGNLRWTSVVTKL